MAAGVAAGGAAVGGDGAAARRPARRLGEGDLELLPGAAGTVVANVLRAATRCDERAAWAPSLGFAEGGADDADGDVDLGSLAGATGSVNADVPRAATRCDERAARAPELGVAAGGGAEGAGEVDCSRTFHVARLEPLERVARGTGASDRVTAKTSPDIGHTEHACSITPD